MNKFRGLWVFVAAVTLIFPIVFLGKALFYPVKPGHPNNAGEERASPHLSTFEAERDINRKESDALQLRRQMLREKFELLTQRLGLLQNDVGGAHSDFLLSIDRALGIPLTRAEQLLNDLKLYNASESVYEDQAQYSTQTAAYLGAIGAQPLAFPQRNFGYLDSVHKSALQYVQAFKAFKSDAEAARLAFERDISRIQNELLSLQLNFSDIDVSELEIGGLERSACQKALDLAKSLGPFLSHDLIPEVPGLQASDRDDFFRSEGFSTLAQWIGNARVNAEDALRMAIKEQTSSIVFVNADELVQRLAMRGRP